MEKIYILINLFILSIYLISFVNSEVELITYNFTTHTGEKIITSSTQKKNFVVDFSEKPSDIPSYIKVQVTSTDSNPAPLLYFSNTDPDCIQRNQIIKNPNNKEALFWAKKEEFSWVDEALYILIECENDGCSYTINIEGTSTSYLYTNFVYSYLVSSYNRKMQFEILGSQNNAYITIALDGSSSATLSVENIPEIASKYKTGSVITYFLENEEINSSSLASVIINGREGEYLTLSSHIINVSENKEGMAQKGLILPNGPEVTGYLEEKKIQKECFPIDLTDEKYREIKQLYITGKIYTKYALFYLEDDEEKEIEASKTEIIDGQLSYAMNIERKLYYICFELPDGTSTALKQSSMVFTFSVSEPSILPNLYKYYPPQLTGEIFRRMIPKGQIVFFSGTKYIDFEKKYDYSLYQIKGLAKMYIADCRQYPDCHYSEEGLNNLIDPKNTNQMYIWTATEDKSSALGNEKYVMVVHCIDDDNENNGFCEFETSIFSKGQDITLIQDEKFSKFVISGEEGNFIVDLNNGVKLRRLTFDIMIFSGDIDFSVVNNNADIYFDKYYLSNKIYIHFNIPSVILDKVLIYYKAITHSFFTIQYSISTETSDEVFEYIPSGESYLVQIDPTSASKTKDIFLSNQFYKNKNQYLSNFFELNCEFEVKRDDSKIKFFDGYAQEILDSSLYNLPYYQYTIKITESDISNYNHKMCMLYVAGYEDESNPERELVVKDNINQQIIFNEKFKKMRFLYPLADKSKALVVHLNVIDKAFYNIKIYVKNNAIIETNLTRTHDIYVRDSLFTSRCETNTLCPIIVQIKFISQIAKTNPMAEITIREILNVPSYLQKGQAKLDFVAGDNIYYLYTDIGKNDIGEITINFLREFGYLWARVVRKDQEFIDSDANWKGIYKMPSKESGDSLPFNEYTKTLTVTSENTEICIEGCYLLISIRISQVGEIVEDYKFYPFSIITKITPNSGTYTDIPKVVIQVDEFIIGSVNVAQNEKINEFYEIWFPHDSETILFDWQSSVAGLYVNLGGIRPTNKNADFKLLPPGKDDILYLTKNEILEKAAMKQVTIPYENSLQDMNLVIGVWTDKTDSIDTELYSLRVHQPDSDVENNLDITEVKTDQKILCDPIEISSNEFRCLFIVTYDIEDVNMRTPILAYGSSLNHGALSYMYANFIDRTIYDEFNRTQLAAVIPTNEAADLNSKEEGVDYIYVKTLKKENYLFINVVTDRSDPIMIITSMPVYNYIAFNLFEFYPNPNTEQLLSLPEEGEVLNIAFPCSETVLVNIDDLYGHAEISWKNDPEKVYVMRGAGDRISLSSGSGIDQLVIRKISENNSINLKTMENPGFVFSISFIIINNEAKFNEINYGKSLEIAYKDVDLPVFLYSKIGSEYSDINIAISFKDNEIDQGGIHPHSPRSITAQIVKESVIYEAKKSQDLRPSEKEISGYYDTALKTAQIFLSEDIINSYNVKESDNPTIYIRIDKEEEERFIDNTNGQFSIEAQVSGVNDGVIPVEKIYHYGRVRNTAWKETCYRLKTDKNKPIMRIQIAFNSNNLDFVVTDTENSRKNTTFLHTEKERGKIFITLNIQENKQLYYLYIYKKENTFSEIHLNNYAFKYINVRTEEEIFDYPIYKSPEIQISEEIENKEDVIKCTFNKLDIAKDKANITYFFKVVENSTYYYGEEFNTIAVTESPYYSVYQRNPKDNGGLITLTARGDLSNWVYLNVIAQVQQNNALEYISYNGKYFLRPDPNKKESEDDSPNHIYLIVGSILLAIIIGLIVFILIYRYKNRNLMNKVQHVSFQKTNSNSDPNLLLQKSQSSISQSQE